MIKRSKRSKNFTVVNNEIYADNGLSFEAMGLLTYLLSKPDNWQINAKALAKVTEGTDKKNGINKIYSMLNVLIEAGYVFRQKNADGSVDYTIYDEPVHQNSEQQDPNHGNPVQAKPNHGNPVQGFSDVLIRTERQQELNVKKELKGNKANSPPKAKKSDYDLVIDKILSLHGEIPQPQKITDGRKAVIKQCLKRYGLEMVLDMLDKAAQSPMTSQGWFDFDFMWKDTPRAPRFLNIIEGKYDQAFNTGNQGSRQPNQPISANTNADGISKRHYSDWDLSSIPENPYVPF